MIAGRTDMYGKVHDTICSSSNAPNYSSCYCDIIERTEQRALRQAREAVAALFAEDSEWTEDEILAAIAAIRAREEKP